jgi:hypothetical protein
MPNVFPFQYKPLNCLANTPADHCVPLLGWYDFCYLDVCCFASNITYVFIALCCMCLKPISASGYLTGPCFGVFNRIKVKCDGFLQIDTVWIVLRVRDIVSFIFYQLLHLMYFWPCSLTIADCTITIVCVGLYLIHCVCFDHSLVCYNFSDLRFCIDVPQFDVHSSHSEIG